MDLGERFTALENHIFAFAKMQFESNGVPPTFARIIMEAVYSKFQDRAIEQMIMNQIKIEGDEPEEKRVTQSEESIQETVNALKEFYGGKEEENGGTENSPA